MVTNLSSIGANNSVQKMNNVNFGAGSAVQISAIANNPIKDVYTPSNQTEDKKSLVNVWTIAGGIALTGLMAIKILKGRKTAVTPLEQKVADTVKNTYQEYKKMFSKAGIKNIPMPKVTYNALSKDDAIATYYHGLNIVDVNEKAVAEIISKKCFLVKDGKVLTFRKAMIEGSKKYGHTQTLFNKDNEILQELVKKTGAEIRNFDDKITEPLIEGVINHEMRHYAQGIIMANDPKTAKEYSNIIKKFIGTGELSKLLKKLGLDDMYNYTSSNIGVDFARKTKKGDVVYNAESFIKELTDKLTKKGIGYHSSVTEIDANHKAYSYLCGKYKDVKDNGLRLQLDALKDWFHAHDPYHWGEGTVGLIDRIKNGTLVDI